MLQLVPVLLVLFILQVDYSSACGSPSGGPGASGRISENAIADPMISYPWRSWNPYDPYGFQYQPSPRFPRRKKIFIIFKSLDSLLLNIVFCNRPT